MSVSKGINNKRIAINTVLLYIRTVIVLIISLYTSRLILKALGVEDLGIYNVVGGIVALMAFFRSALTKSTSRFITYEIGENGRQELLSRIFSSAMTIHILIAVVALVLGETFGLLILEHWTDIPELRQDAAFVVYQCALGIFCLQLLIAPYESIIIAHENMSVFAYMSILNALLKLGIVYMLLLTSMDRLVLYGLLMLSVDIIILSFYYIYDKKKYPEFKFKFIWDMEYSRKMFSFSGWTLLGSSTNAATQQGISLLFNNFVGLIANAALGFANQINGAVSNFVSSFQTAFNPQIIKLYARQELEQMHLLMCRASKFSFVMAFVLALPLISNMNFVLHVWLGEVPPYTVEFCQLILVCCVIDSVSGVFNTAITATGKIRGFQIGISCSFLLDLFTATLLLLMDLHPALVFGSRIITRGFINMLIMLFFTKKQLKFSIRHYAIIVLVPILISLIITIPIIWGVAFLLDGWQSLFVSCIVSVVLMFVITYFVVMDKRERIRVNAVLVKMVKKQKFFIKID